MKRIALLFVGILGLSLLSAGAQSVIVKGGYNYQFSNVQALKSGGRSGWQAGAGYQTETVRGFSFQPELMYKVSSVNVQDNANLRISYLELPLNVQWGPDLLIARPFLFAGPYLGVKVRNALKGNWESIGETTRKDIVDHLKGVEYGVSMGIGIDVFKFQICGKVNWNLGKLSEIDSFPTLNNKQRSFEISVGLRF